MAKWLVGLALVVVGPLAQAAANPVFDLWRWHSQDGVWTFDFDMKIQPDHIDATFKCHRFGSEGSAKFRVPVSVGRKTIQILAYGEAIAMVDGLPCKMYLNPEVVNYKVSGYNNSILDISNKKGSIRYYRLHD